MPEEKQLIQKQRRAEKVEEQGGFFQMKRFLSDVATVGQAVLKEAQSLHNHEELKKKGTKPPIATVPPSFKDDKDSHRNENSSVNETYPQKERASHKPLAGKTITPKTYPTPITPTAAGAATIVEIPKEVIDQPGAIIEQDQDWEIVSTEDRGSRTSNGSFVACTKAGSIRSITSIDHENSSHTTLSVPFKIQRTNSSSTLDSQDNALGPSGKGVLGVDYLEHIVLPTDTLQGICIAYKVSATHLRRANHFSGPLHSAPKKLLIPLSKQALRAGFIRVQDTDTKEYKLHSFLAEFPNIHATEAKAYLELANWDLNDALHSAKEDKEWEVDDREGKIDGDVKSEKAGFISGQIKIKVGFRKGIPVFKLKGTGHSSKNSNKEEKGGSDCSTDDEIDKKGKIVIYKQAPAIETKSVLAEDLYNAAPQHDVYGFELKPIPKRNSSLDT
jgi:LysM repeat protein